MGVTLLAVAFMPTNAAALTGLIACVSWGVLLSLLRRHHDVVLSRATKYLLVAGGLLVLGAFLRSLFAVNPWVSVTGLIGQHTGSLLWVAAFAVFALTLTRYRAGDVGRITRTFAITGAVLAVVALVDAAGLLGDTRFSLEPAGVFENSLSLAQVLVVSLGASVAWALARKGAERWIAIASGLLCVAALVVADARAAWLGVAVGVVLSGVSVWVARHRRAAVVPLRWAVWITIALALLFALGWATLGDGVTSDLEVDLEQVSTDRTVLWASAFERADDALVIGSGPEQYSAWATWDSVPGVSLAKTGAYDSHNVLLWWLLAVGIPGLVGALIVTALCLERLFAAFVASGFQPAVIALAGGIVAWGVSVLLIWVNPIALLMVTVLLATLSASADRAIEARSPKVVTDSLPSGAVRGLVVYGPTVLAVSAAVSLVIIFSGDILAEYSWARAVDSGAVDSETALAIATRSHDPSLSALAATVLVREASRTGASGVQSLSMAEDMLKRDSVWHVDAAFERFQLASARMGMSGDEDVWKDAEAAIAAGKEADPASGLWDYSAAVQAAEFGLEEAAITHATVALEYDVPPEVRTFLEELTAPQ